MPLPLVSVVIPAYNSEKYISNALDSVISQTYEYWECIVVDDCSSDSTRNIVRTYSERDERIRLIAHNENAGVAAARNDGILAANGIFIAFLDSDDEWTSEKISLQTEVLLNGAVLTYSGAVMIDEYGDSTGRNISVPQRITYNDLFSGNDIVTSTVMVQADIMRAHLFERPDLHEDLVSWARILRTHTEAVGITQNLTRYRLTPGSKSRSKLKSAVTTWKTYRYLGLNFFACVRSFARYTLHGIARYFG